MSAISGYVLPIFLLLVFLTAFINNTKAFDHFVEGAKEGMQTTIQLVPNIVGMIVGIKVFLASGIVEAIANVLQPVLDFIHVDAHVLPLMILRPLSGSAALSVTTDLISIHGPDSYLGRLASVMQGSTDTTIYIIGLYFSSVGIRKIKYSLIVGLLADLMAILLSLLIVSYWFY